MDAPMPSTCTSSCSSTKLSAPSRGRNAVTVLPFFISCTRTHFLTAEFGCFASIPTFSKTIPRACGAPPNGLAFLSRPRFLLLYVPIDHRCFFLLSFRTLPENRPSGDFAIFLLHYFFWTLY